MFLGIELSVIGRLPVSLNFFFRYLRGIEGAMMKTGDRRHIDVYLLYVGYLYLHSLFPGIFTCDSFCPFIPMCMASSV